MAEKKAERVYTIPLRPVWIKQTHVQRTNKAVSHIKGFLMKHFHADDVKLSQPLNELLWRRGVKKPPSSVQVKAKIEDGVVTARLPEEKEVEKAEKKPEKSTLEKAKEMLPKVPMAGKTGPEKGKAVKEKK